METTTNFLFTSFMNLQIYLTLHKKKFKQFFSEIALDSPYTSIDFYVLTDLFNNFLLLSENMTIISKQMEATPPFYLNINGFMQEKTLINELLDDIQFKMKEDLRGTLKNIKKKTLSGFFDTVDLFVNPIFKQNLIECVENIKNIKEEIQNFLIVDSEKTEIMNKTNNNTKKLVKKKKMNEVYIKKTQDKLKCYNMLLDYWSHESLEMPQNPLLLNDCQAFVREFMRLYHKLEKNNKKLTTIKKSLKKFFHFSTKVDNLSLSEFENDLASNLNFPENNILSCQNIVDTNNLHSFSKILYKQIKDYNSHLVLEVSDILMRKDLEGEKINDLSKKITTNDENCIKSIVYACDKVFSDMTTSILLKFNAIKLVKNFMDLSVPLFVKSVDLSLLKNLAILIYLGSIKEIFFSNEEEQIFTNFMDLSRECVLIWGKTYNRINKYSNFTQVVNILVEKNVEFPIKLKYFADNDAWPLDKQLQYKLTREKHFIKTFLENSADEQNISEFLENIKKIDNLLDNSEVYNEFDALPFIKEKELTKSLKKEYEDLTKKRIDFLSFRNNVLKLLIKNKYERESYSISSRLTPGYHKNSSENNSGMSTNLRKPEKKEKDKTFGSFKELLVENDDKIPIKLKNNAHPDIKNDSNSRNEQNINRFRNVEAENELMINKISNDNKILKEKEFLVRALQKFSKNK